MFETVTPGISGHTAQAEPTAAAIAKRFSAMALFGRRLPERARASFVMPASENLHTSGHPHVITAQTCTEADVSAILQFRFSATLGMLVSRTIIESLIYVAQVMPPSSPNGINPSKAND